MVVFVVQEEYMSRDEEEDQREEVGVASIAIGKPIPYTSPFASHLQQCRMPHGSHYKGITSHHTN
jgi:hypothetical protein